MKKDDSIGTHAKRIIVMGIIGLFIFESLIGFINFSENVKADGYDDYPPPIYGDWIITTTTYVKNETIVLNGNLTIRNGGSLTLNNVTLVMNCTFDGEFHIEVQSGGELNILDGSNITAYSTSCEYLFWVRSGSNFTMRDSELHECGYEAGWAGTHSGLYIQTNDVLIENNTIIGDENGIVFRYGDRAKIRNNTIIAKDLEGRGIFVYSDSNKLEIINNTITAGMWGINLWDTSSNKIISNVIKTTNIKRDDRGAGIFLGYSHSDIISNNKILEASRAIELYEMYGDTIIVNSTLQATNYSFRLSDSKSATIINTTFDKNKVYFVDPNSNIAVQWYLRVNVVDPDNNPLSNASIRVQDNMNGTFDKSYSSDVNGCARWIPCTEYVQNKTSKKYYTPHNITATSSGYIENYAIPEPHINMSKNVTISLTPDPIPPISSLSTNSSYWNITGEIEIMYNVTDPSPASGLRDIIVYYNYSINNNSNWSGWIENWNITFTGSPLFSSGVFVFNFPEGEGYYRLYSIASDTANNQEHTKSIPDLLVAFDKTKPYSQLTQLSTYQNTTIFTINYTQTDGFGSGVKNLSLYYRKNLEENWIKYGDYPSTISQFTFNSSSVGGDGVYEFFVIANDYAGNIESLPESGNETWTIVDTTKPLSNVDMLQYYRNSSPFTITATAFDTSGVQKVELWYNKDMGLWIKYAEKTLPPWSWNFDTLLTGGDGFYEFYTRAYDNPNNYEDAPIPKDTQTIVDTIKPIISVISPQNGSTITSSTVPISWVGSDTTSDIDHYEIKIDNSTYVNVSVDTNYTFFEVTDGDHIIIIKAVDKAGNSEEILIEINIDTKQLSLDILITLYIVIGLIVVIVILVVFLSIQKKKSSQPPPP